MENQNHRTQQICSCDESTETEIQKLLLDREQERMSRDADMETARAAELESLGGLVMEEAGQGVSS